MDDTNKGRSKDSSERRCDKVIMMYTHTTNTILNKKENIVRYK